jgi:hypothetical protein
MELVEFTLDDGGSVLVEVTGSPYEETVGHTDDLIARVGVSFDAAIGRVRDAAMAALGQFQQMTRQPNEVEITFGVKLDTEVGAVIAKTGVEGQLGIKLTWRAPAGEPVAPAAPPPAGATG